MNTPAAGDALAAEEFRDINAGTERGAYLKPSGPILTKDTDAAQAISDRYFSSVRSDWVRVEL